MAFTAIRRRRRSVLRKDSCSRSRRTGLVPVLRKDSSCSRRRFFLKGGSRSFPVVPFGRERAARRSAARTRAQRKFSLEIPASIREGPRNPSLLRSARSGRGGTRGAHHAGRRRGLLLNLAPRIVPAGGDGVSGNRRAYPPPIFSANKLPQVETFGSMDKLPELLVHGSESLDLGEFVSRKKYGRRRATQSAFHRRRCPRSTPARRRCGRFETIRTAPLLACSMASLIALMVLPAAGSTTR